MPNAIIIHNTILYVIVYVSVGLSAFVSFPFHSYQFHTVYTTKQNVAIYLGAGLNDPNSLIFSAFFFRLFPSLSIYLSIATVFTSLSLVSFISVQRFVFALFAGQMIVVGGGFGLSVCVCMVISLKFCEWL